MGLKKPSVTYILSHANSIAHSQYGPKFGHKVEIIWEESISFKDSEAGSVPFNFGNYNLPLILNLKYCDIF